MIISVADIISRALRRHNQLIKRQLDFDMALQVDTNGSKSGNAEKQIARNFCEPDLEFEVSRGNGLCCSSPSES